MKKVSDKRAKQLREYAVLRKQFLEEHTHCFACIDLKHFCYGATPYQNLTIQHCKGRIGNLLNDTRYWKVLCLAHNLYIEHTGTQWAKDNNLKIK